MNRKSFLILLALVALLGGVGLGLFWQDLGSWRKSDAKIGAKLFEKLPVNDIAQIKLTDGKGSVVLAIKDQRWVVEQRNGYGANNQDIGDLLIKLTDLKVVQTEAVGDSLLPRLNLVDPAKNENKNENKTENKDAKAGDAKDAKDTKAAEAIGTRLELFDKSGKSAASILLGKQVIKIEDSPLPIKPHTPVGRYVLSPGNPTVLVVSDALVVAEANPGRWLAKNFFKAERIRSLTVSGDGAQWKLARPEEYGQWKFADGGGELDASAAVGAVNGLANLAFSDVATDVKPEEWAKARTYVADTYDNLVYTVKVAKKADSDDYYLTVAISGEPPRERKPEKGEKPADKERLDKQFTDALTKLDERLKAEKALASWTFVVAGKTLEPLLKDRAALIAKPRKPGAGGAPGMPPGMMFPGMR
jgi:hypothetical protein